jgi:hypothetical protein
MGLICVQKSRKLSNWLSASGLGRHSCRESLPTSLSPAGGSKSILQCHLLPVVEMLDQGGVPSIINVLLASMQNRYLSLGFLRTSHCIKLGRCHLFFVLIRLHDPRVAVSAVAVALQQNYKTCYPHLTRAGLHLIHI